MKTKTWVAQDSLKSITKEIDRMFESGMIKEVISFTYNSLIIVDGVRYSAVLIYK